MMKYTPAILRVILLLSLVTVTSCGKKVESTSTIQHDHGEPIRVNEGWNWAQLTSSQFEDIVLKNFLDVTDKPLKDSDPLVVRSQFWLDRLDSKLRELYPEKMANVPAPKAKVLSTESVNAFVSPALICFNIPVTGVSGGEKDLEILHVEPQSGALSDWTHSEARTKCVDSADRSVLTAAINEFNIKSKNGCSIKYNGGSATLSPECRFEDTDETIRKADKIVLLQTANWITIFTGLMSGVSTEGEFVGVVAHELGHYYKTHTNTLEDEYGFFYTLGEKNPNQMPQEDVALQEFGKKVFEASKQVMNNMGTYKKIKDQKISPYFYSAAGDIAMKACKSGNCDKTCEDVVKLKTDTEYAKVMGFYPFTPVEDTTPYFLKYEVNAVACLKSVTFGTTGIKKSQVISALMNPQWYGLDIIPDRFKDYIEGVYATTLNRIKSYPDSNNVYELMIKITTKMEKEDVGYLELVSQAYDRRLGQYTTEQEADELSVEWMEMIGLGPKSAVDTMMFLSSLSPEDSMGGFAYGGKRCKELYDNNWEDENGDQVFVPIGDYSEVHHGSCFRAFNASREIIAHDYSTASQTIDAPGGSWDDVRKKAEKSNGVSSLVKPKPGSSYKKSGIKINDATNPLETCPLSYSLFH